MLVSLLVTVLTMGGLGVLVLGATGGAPLSIPTTIGVPTTGGPSTSSTLSVESAAERTACIQDADAIVTALGDYQLLNSVTLGREAGIVVGNPATYPDGHDAQDLLGSSFLSSWPQSSSFALSLSTETAGDVAVYVPATSRHPVLFNAETARTGCNAL